MKCVICKHGETQSGVTTAIFERNTTTLIFKGVEAEVCQSCGESYLSEEISQKLLQQANEAATKGVEVDIRRFNAA